MNDKNNSTERAELRNTLLSNGYRPLPLLDKGIRIKGWSRAEINQEWIDKYRRSGAYANTGIRCDDLIAFDIDVLDEAIADEIEAYVESAAGETDLCRVGHWPKRLLLYRAAGELPTKSARTARFVGDHMVELLCGHGRQFASFGVHPSGVNYEWLDGISPLDVPFELLPQVEAELAYKILDDCENIIAAHGLGIKTPSVRSGIAGMNEYDLAEDTDCLIDGNVITWRDLKGDLDKRGVFGDIRRDHGEFGDSSAIHFMLAKGSGEPCAHDFVMDCTHWDAPLSDMLAELLPAQPPIEENIFIDDGIADLIDNCVIISDATVRRLYDPLRPYPLAGFVQNHAHLQVPAPTKANPNKTIPFTDVWKKSSETLRADYAAMRPDFPDDDIMRIRTARVMNTYFPPLHDAKTGGTDTFHEFIGHLIPKRNEAEIYIDWLAAKVANPSYRMPGMVMVTPAYGTGRGTLCQIMGALLGTRYVVEIPFSQLVGSGGQSVFNEFLADALMVTVPEALEETEDRSKWLSRRLAYEQLKLVCDPVACESHIRRKYGRNSVEWIFASLFVSSNHLDALAIEPGDRRLIVLDNTERPLVEAGTLQDQIHAWRRVPGNIGALHAELFDRGQSITFDPYAMPPMTPAKERMIEAGQSDMDLLFEMFATQSPGAICTHSQWRGFANKMRFSAELDLPVGDRLDSALTAVMKQHGRRCEALSGGQLKVSGNPVRPWIIRDFDTWKGNSDLDEIRREILRNGAPGGEVLEFPPKV